MRIYPLYKIFIFISFAYCYSFTISKKTNKTIHYAINNKNNQCIISSKNKKSYCNDESKIFLDENEFYFNKKLITISPGGYKGFYMLGVLTYIKENYETDNLIFSGASAGSWNGLFMCYKGDPLTFAYNFLDINIRKAKSISELQYFMKYKLLTTYKNEDFDLKKLFIGVTTFKFFLPKINIYSDFNDLEDAINCCMASSHIPLITGGIYNRYKDMFSFDGGFSKYPYLNGDKLLHVSFNMWDEIKDKKKVIKFSEFFSMSKNNLLELFDNGYDDAKIHKNYLDEIFELKNKNNEDAPEF
jgi:hypothetical protein